MKPHPLAVVLPLLGACASVAPVADAPTGRLARDGKAYLALPTFAEDVFPVVPGRLKDSVDTIPAVLADLLVEVLDTRLSGTVRGEAAASSEAAVAAAKAAGAQYAIVVTIHHWEVRDATFLSSKPDCTRVRLSTYDASTGELVDESTLETTEDRWFGIGENEGLLRQAAAKYAEARFS